MNFHSFENGFGSMTRLSEAFKDLAGDPVQIPPRDCEDLRIFLERLRVAQELTRAHNIEFD